MFAKLAKWIGYLFLGLIALAVLGSIFGEDKPKGSDRPSAAVGAVTPSADTKPAPQKVAAIKISASQLFNEYQANEVAADQRYKGKWLLVSGTVQSIDKNAFNNIVVRLRTSNEFMGAMAHLDDAHEGLAASLNKGQKIQLECKGGGIVIGSPVLKECVPV